MSYKPDEQILISWLYGELDEKETAKLEQYFRENPAALAEMNEMSSVRDRLAFLGDKEVIAPPMLMDDPKQVVHLWNAPWVKTIMAIAASFLLLIVAGRLSGLDIRYQGNELRVSFGGGQAPDLVPVQQTLAQAKPDALSSGEVQSMINAALNKNNEWVALKLNDQEKKVDRSVRSSLSDHSQKMNGLMKETALASQDQVRSFVSGLQTENLQLMKDYLQLSSTEQKKYVEGLLVDFSKYLQEQRSQDLTVFQARMKNLEQNSNQFKQETEQLLTGILTNGTANKNKNSY